ncbi:MAG: class I SAM-dependent methyltransferase [Anaerolineae bacterium]|nr:class I SAM-dependent methyltransferase [Anaerolineae bacterium]
MTPNDPRQTTLDYFNQRSDFWHDIYERPQTFTGYSVLKQHHTVMQVVQQTQTPGNAILDVGCGAGITVLELAERGYQASGIDFAPNMIERAKQDAEAKGVVCDFQVASAENLPYPTQHFDMVIALGLVGNLHDDTACLGEIRRVLKPSGMVLLTMPNVLALDRWISVPRSLPIIFGHRFRSQFRRIGNLERRLRGIAPKDAADLRFGKSTIPYFYRRHLTQAGFQEVGYSSITFGPFLPLGLRVWNDPKLITMSEAICKRGVLQKWLNWGGNIVIFQARLAP